MRGLSNPEQSAGFKLARVESFPYNPVDFRILCGNPAGRVAPTYASDSQ